MVIRHNIPVYEICWLNYAQGGVIGTLYEPENKEELHRLCCMLYSEHKSFEIIGHTSNVYFTPSFNANIIVSTRKVRFWQIYDDYIYAECGVSVRQLSREMVEKGIQGFEGLVDLPGTVAASVYGNASCFACSINSLLKTAEILLPSGDVVEMSPEELKLEQRSSAIKRGEVEGVILSVRLKKEVGDPLSLKRLAEVNHIKRKTTQPSPKDNLGSIYKGEQKRTILGYVIFAAAKIYRGILKTFGIDLPSISIVLFMLGKKSLIPYVSDWNRFIWKDKESHDAFWEYHRIHQLLFTNNEFEIEIK